MSGPTGRDPWGPQDPDLTDPAGRFADAIRSMFLADFAQSGAAAVLSPDRLAELAAVAQGTAQRLLDIQARALTSAANEAAATLAVAASPDLSHGKAIRLAQAVLDLDGADEAEQWRRAEEIVNDVRDRPRRTPALPDGHVADVVPLRPRG